MLTRFKSLKEREEYAFMRYDLEPGDPGPSQGAFLAELLGLTSNGGHLVKRDQIIIIDMNTVEDEVARSLGPGSKDLPIAPAGRTQEPFSRFTCYWRKPIDISRRRRLATL